MKKGKQRNKGKTAIVFSILKDRIELVLDDITKNKITAQLILFFI